MKYAFRDLQEAEEFYEAVEGSHVARALYLGDGMEETVYYVSRPEIYEGDPDTGMEAYLKAREYESFIDGSVEAPADEWTYFPGFEVVEWRRK